MEAAAIQVLQKWPRWMAAIPGDPKIIGGKKIGDQAEKKEGVQQQQPSINSAGVVRTWTLLSNNPKCQYKN